MEANPSTKPCSGVLRRARVNELPDALLCSILDSVYRRTKPGSFWHGLVCREWHEACCLVQTKLRFEGHSSLVGSTEATREHLVRFPGLTELQLTRLSSEQMEFFANALGATRHSIKRLHIKTRDVSEAEDPDSRYLRIGGPRYDAVTSLLHSIPNLEILSFDREPPVALYDLSNLQQLETWGLPAGASGRKAGASVAGPATLLDRLPSLRQVHIHEPEARDIAQLAHITGLEELVLEGGHIEAFPPTAGALKSLRVLKVDDVSWDCDNWVPFLHSLTGLTRLWGVHLWLLHDPDGPKGNVCISQLRDLRVLANDDSESDMPTGFSQLTALTTLHILSGYFDNWGYYAAFRVLSGLTNLRNLEIPDVFPTFLSTLQGLRTVCCYASATKRSWTVPIGLTYIPALRHLTLVITNMDGASPTRLLSCANASSTFPKMRKLLSLELHGQCLAWLPPELSRAPALQSLKIYSRLLDCLPRWLGTMRLRKLDVSLCTRITSIPRHLMRIPEVKIKLAERIIRTPM